MYKYLLSIVIPLYNSADFISNTLDNLLSAKILDDEIEIVLIDDGSLDNTQLICSKYSNLYTFIKYYRKDNGGIASARNFGLEHCDSRYVFFHDHDDIFDVDNLREIINLLKRFNTCNLFVFNSLSKINNNYTNHIKINPKNSMVAYNDNKTIGKMINLLFSQKKSSDYCDKFISIWSCIYDTNFLKSNNILFHKFIKYEDDLLFQMEILLNKPTIVFCDLNIYTWVNLDCSTSHKKNYNPDYIRNKNRLILYVQNKLNEQNRKKYNFNKTCFNFVCYWYNGVGLLKNYFNQNENLINFESFKKVCKDNKVRETFLLRTNVKKSFKMKILSFLFYFKMYKIIFKILFNCLP